MPSPSAPLAASPRAASIRQRQWLFFLLSSTRPAVCCSRAILAQPVTLSSPLQLGHFRPADVRGGNVHVECHSGSAKDLASRRWPCAALLWRPAVCSSPCTTVLAGRN